VTHTTAKTFLNRKRTVQQQRERLGQWSLWECDPATLRRMATEVQQEQTKIAEMLALAEKEFDQYIAVGDPLTVETLRRDVRALGRAWDHLAAKARLIETILQQKGLDERIVRLGKRLGIDDLTAYLRWLRVITLALSLIAVTATLIPLAFSETFHTLDRINLICSLILSGEFVFRLALVSERRSYFVRRALDIFLSLPLVALTAGFPDLTFLMRLFTLLRMGRLLRLLLGERKDRIAGVRFLRSPEFALLQRALLVGLALVIVAAVALRGIEGYGGEFNNFNDNLWWGIKVVLTANVDSNPETLIGRALTVAILVLGVAATGILIATITTVLVNLSEESSGDDQQQDAIAESITAIRAQLDLLTETRQTAARALTEGVHRLTTADHAPEAMIEGVVSDLVSNLACLSAALYTLDEGGREAVRLTSAGDPTLTPPERVAFDSGLIGRAAALARRGSDQPAPIMEKEPMPLADGIAFAFPLFVRGGVATRSRVHGMGVLHVVIPQAHARDALITGFIGITGNALAQYLYTRDRDERHAALLANIADMQTTLETVTTTLEYRKLLFVIASGAATTLDSAMSKVMLRELDEDGTPCLRGVAWHGMDDVLGASLYTKMGEGLSGLCAQTGSPVKSSNLLTDQRVTTRSSQALRSGMRSELCVPIRAQGELLGVLSVMSREHKRFSPEEETLLGMLAGQAGAAILNARAYGEGEAA